MKRLSCMLAATLLVILPYSEASSLLVSAVEDGGCEPMLCIHGHCNKSICVCEEGYRGVNCEHQVLPTEDETTTAPSAVPTVADSVSINSNEPSNIAVSEGEEGGKGEGEVSGHNKPSDIGATAASNESGKEDIASADDSTVDTGSSTDGGGVVETASSEATMTGESAAVIADGEAPASGEGIVQEASGDGEAIIRGADDTTVITPPDDSVAVAGESPIPTEVKGDAEGNGGHDDDVITAPDNAPYVTFSLTIDVEDPGMKFQASSALLVGRKSKTTVHVEGGEGDPRENKVVSAVASVLGVEPSSIRIDSIDGSGRVTFRIYVDSPAAAEALQSTIATSTATAFEEAFSAEGLDVSVHDVTPPYYVLPAGAEEAMDPVAILSKAEEVEEAAEEQKEVLQGQLEEQNDAHLEAVREMEEEKSKEIKEQRQDLVQAIIEGLEEEDDPSNLEGITDVVEHAAGNYESKAEKVEAKIEAAIAAKEEEYEEAVEEYKEGVKAVEQNANATIGEITQQLVATTVPAPSLAITDAATTATTATTTPTYAAEGSCDPVCYQHGMCHDGLCKCEEGYRGTWCTELTVSRNELAELQKERMITDAMPVMPAVLINATMDSFLAGEGMLADMFQREEESKKDRMETLKQDFVDIIAYQVKIAPVDADIQEIINGVKQEYKEHIMVEEKRYDEVLDALNEKGRLLEEEKKQYEAAVEKYQEEQTQFAIFFMSFRPEEPSRPADDADKLDLITYEAKMEAYNAELQDYSTRLMDYRPVMPSEPAPSASKKEKEVYAKQLAKYRVESAKFEVALEEHGGLPCGPECTEHGECLNGICKCEEGYRGVWCTDIVKCADECEEHGRCEANGICVCDAGYRGVWCTFAAPQGETVPITELPAPSAPGPAASEVEIAAYHEALGAYEAAQEEDSSGLPLTIPADVPTAPPTPGANATEAEFEAYKEAMAGFQAEAAPSEPPLGASEEEKRLYEEAVSQYEAAVVAFDEAAQKAEAPCLDTCEDHGTCILGKCHCDEGFEGEGCEKAIPPACDPICSKHGRCIMGICLCSDGYRGVWCDEKEAPKPPSKPNLKKASPKELQSYRDALDKFEAEIHNEVPASVLEDVVAAIPSTGSESVSGEEESVPATEGGEQPAAEEKVSLSPCINVAEPTQYCSGHGRCIDNERCKCDDPFGGEYCDEPLYDDCPDNCSGHGICFKEGYNGQLISRCKCDAELHQAWYGHNCGIASAVSTQIAAEVSYTTPEGVIIVPVSNNATLTVNFRDSVTSEIVKGVIPAAAEAVKLQIHVPGSDGKIYPVLIRVYDENALTTLPDAFFQFTSSTSYTGDSSVSIVGPILLEAGNYVQIGDADASEVRKILSITVSESVANEVNYIFDKPLELGHVVGSFVYKMEICKQVPEPIPLVALPECSSDCNTANGGGVCALSDDKLSALCKCSFGWNGPTCESQGCRGECTSSWHGVCEQSALTNEYRCKCMNGFTGDDCSVGDVCGDKMAPCVNGECRNGECVCGSRFTGSLCEVESCPKDCSYPQGKCLEDESGSISSCVCSEGYVGVDCSAPELCPNDCTSHGSCVSDDLLGMKCACDKGWSGRACQTEVLCTPEDCSHHGTCTLGECVCDAGWTGPDCASIIPCPNDCNASGACLNGTCACNDGFIGADCSVRISCENDCSGNGLCSAGTCHCFPGYRGDSCELSVPCHDACEAHGQCVYGGCVCDRGWTGENCDQLPVPCPVDSRGEICGGIGICQDGVCLCPDGVGNASCDVTVAACDPLCFQHGSCVENKCRCDPGWEGGNCDVPKKCPVDEKSLISTLADCSDHGICWNGECQCIPGWTGPACETPLTCFPPCGVHGKCSGSTCMCDSGWGGKVCDQTLTLSDNAIICPEACNQNGYCQSDGTCACSPEWTGAACSVRKLCPGDCNNHGFCYHGDCFCDPGYDGESCHIELQCPSTPKGALLEVCSGHGSCQFGQCVCSDDFYGPDCSKSRSFEARLAEAKRANCPTGGGGSKKPCGGRGTCLMGQCFCNEGWNGRGCSVKISQDTPCPGGCSKNGYCETEGEEKGRCTCYSGYEGIDCSKMTKEALADATVSCAENCGSMTYGVDGSHGKCRGGFCECDSGWSGTWCTAEASGSRKAAAGGGGKGAAFKELRAVADVVDANLVNECPNDCTISSTGFSNGVCVKGTCLCNSGYAGDDCSFSCPKRCSELGTCTKRAGDASYSCYCQSGWTGVDCSSPVLEKSAMLTTSVVGIAIFLFIGSLFVVPVWKAVIDQRYHQRKLKLINGDLMKGDLAGDGFWLMKDSQRKLG